MSFDELYEGIPLDEAASFFIKLKYGSAGIPQPSAEEVLAEYDALPEEEKIACAEEIEKSAEAKNWENRSTAEKALGTKNENIGQVLGGVGGLGAGLALNKIAPSVAKARIGGISAAPLIGAALGAGAGTLVGQRRDKNVKSAAQRPSLEEKIACAEEMEKEAISLKKVKDVAYRTGVETRDAIRNTPNPPSGWGKHNRERAAWLHLGDRANASREKAIKLMDQGRHGQAEKRFVLGEELRKGFKEAAQRPSLEEYLAQEQAGLQAQNQNELDVLRMQMRQAFEEQKMQQQSGQEAGMQMEQMNAQLAQANSQIQMAQQQAALAQQQAMQAQQASLAKADENLRIQQMATQMREAYQNLRSQIMGVVSQDPAMSVGNELKGSSPELNPANGAALPPTAVPPDAGATAQPPQANAQGSSGVMDQAAPTSEKVGFSMPRPEVLGGVGGAALGAVLARNEGLDGPERHQAAIDKIEGAGGPKGFREAMILAREKAMQAFSQVNRDHPIATTIAGAGIGAAMGAPTGKAIQGLLSKKLQMG